MTIEEFEEMAADIRAIGDGDPESSHALEDQLSFEVLGCVARGEANSQVLAVCMVSLLREDRARWYA